MAKIELSGCAKQELKKLAEFVATKTIKLMNQPENIEVAISFVSKNEIQRLNCEIRGIDKVTDVLSFPSFDIKPGEIIDENSQDAMFLKTEDGFVHFGDMALCLARCKEQAKEYGVTIESEIKKLVIHSMLHLMGYDHIKDEDYVVMNEKEKELDEKIEI